MVKWARATVQLLQGINLNFIKAYPELCPPTAQSEIPLIYGVTIAAYA